MTFLRPCEVCQLEKDHSKFTSLCFLVNLPSGSLSLVTIVILIFSHLSNPNLASSMEGTDGAEETVGSTTATSSFHRPQFLKEVRLKVLTLNTYGVPFYGSRDIDERFQLIGRHFASAAANHDLLLFQEVWREKDYQTLIGYLQDAFPHYHYFYR